MAMDKVKIVAAIGVSDEDVAHVRLLMRKAAKTLTHVWRWGNESSADLFLVDPNDFAGQMARTRAKTTGMRVALICDADVDTDGDLALRRPFKETDIVATLNAVTDAAASVSNVVAARQNDYFVDDASADSELAELPLASDQVQIGADAMPGLDEMIRGNPLLDPYANLKSPRLDDSVTVQSAAPRPSQRSDARAPRDPASFTNEIALDAPKPNKRSTPEDHSTHNLREYLKGGLLGGPSRISSPSSPALVLDPKHAVFHSEGGLPALEIYFQEPLRRSDWKVLTTVEMNTLRSAQPAQPYAKLIWLDALLQSRGSLAKHLDPGGTYRLKSWMELQRDYPRYARIAAAMMQPQRLHEIAAASGSEMSIVFDVVNAFDAIDLLEWSRRAPRHEVPANEGVLSGLMQKLRKPFSKD